MRVPPPLLPLAVILAGYGLQRVWAPAPPVWAGWTVVGWILVTAGIAILVACMVQFSQAKTDIRPDKPSSAVLRTGLYRWSRNPIYASFLVLQIGIGVLMGNLWVVALTPLTFVLLSRLVIAREEAYLERAFGDEYRAFKRAVRRWL